MFCRFLKRESGYSLIEVMASIIILTIAILPMASMFDFGLRSATAGGSYEKVRALANLELEQAKSLPFATVRDNFPGTGTTTYSGSGYYDSGWNPVNTLPPYDTPPLNTEYSGFDYRVEKQYMRQPSQTPGSSVDFAPCDSASIDPTIACNPGTNLIRITVTVRWNNGNTFATYGLVAL